MSRGVNAYGFDFLRAEHNLEDDGRPQQAVAGFAPSGSNDLGVPLVSPSQVAHKPDLEKQSDVLHFLKAHRSAGFLAPNVIYRATGIDLQERDESVAKMLERHPNVKVEQIPDPENPSLTIATYMYQAKYDNVRDKTSLLAHVNQRNRGIGMRDLLDAYDGVDNDLNALITAGDVVAINNTDDKDKILFPRGESFLVELDGIISIPTANGTKGSSHGMNGNNDGVHLVETDVEPRNQIRRGEAICVGGQWFRVSSAIKEGPLSEQPPRAQAPLSVVSLTDMSKKNEADGYIRPLTEKLIPLDSTLPAFAKENLKKADEARERLQKIAHGRGISSGVASQLLSSHAHSSNPTTLAASFASSSLMGPSASRKRPSSSQKSGQNVGAGGSIHSSDQTKKDALSAQEAASDPNLALYSHARRHGCTKDVREMYFDTRKLVPESDLDLHNLLLEHKLLEPGEAFRRPRLKRKANVDNDGKPKKRRYYERKNQRMTNTHLDGTEAGAVLRLALEKQKQGKSVGDGGM